MSRGAYCAGGSSDGAGGRAEAMLLDGVTLAAPQDATATRHECKPRNKKQDRSNAPGPVAREERAATSGGATLRGTPLHGEQRASN